MDNQWIKTNERLPPIGIELFGFVTDELLDEILDATEQAGISAPGTIITNPDVFVCTYTGSIFIAILWCTNCKTWHPGMITPYCWRFKIDAPSFSELDIEGNIKTKIK